MTFRAVLLSGAALAVGGQAYAQDARSNQPRSLEEIVVTAQRRAEKLQDVPISVTALSNETLEKANIVNIRDLQNIAPSLKVSTTGVFMQLSIRGITSTALGPGVENNIAVYIDGFYQPISTTLGGDLANVAGIQILKGPQGTLYGRNATGGAMLVTTRDPSADKMILEGSAGYGNLNDRRLRAYVGLPLGSGLSLGVGGYYRENDGYIKDVGGSDAAPYENWEVRAKLKYEPTDDLTLTLGYNHMWRDDGSTFAYGFYKNIILGAPPVFGFPVPPLGPLRTNQIGVSSVDVKPINSSNLDEGTFKLIWETGAGTLSSYTSYADEKFHVDVDFDGTKLPLQHFDARWFRKTFTQSVDFQTKPTDRVDLTIGGMYYHDKSTQDAPFYFGSQVLNPPVLFSRGLTTQRTKGIAAYVDVTWQAAENLYLNAGVRYSKDKRAINSDLLADFTRPTATFPIVRAPLTKASFDSWTPRFTVRYEVAPDMNVYASYSKGFKSGVFNSTGSDAVALTTPVKPEKVDAFEVGFKSARRGVYFDVAAYYYDYKDLQVNAVQTFIENGVERTATLLTNAATAKIYGLEASVTAPVTDRLNLRAAAAYTHARYKSFRNANPTIEVAPGRNAPIVQDWSDKRIARAPDWTFSIGADYTIPVGDGEVVVAANGAYSSKYAPESSAYDPVTRKDLFYQDGYFQANATVDWHLPGDKVVLGVWVNNLTDKEYKIVDTASNLGTKIVLSAPRTYGVKVGYKY